MDRPQMDAMMAREADRQAGHTFAGRASRRPYGVTTYYSCGAAFFRFRETGNPDDDVTAADVALVIHQTRMQA